MCAIRPQRKKHVTKTVSNVLPIVTASVKILARGKSHSDPLSDVRAGGGHCGPLFCGSVNAPHAKIFVLLGWDTEYSVRLHLK